MQLENVNILFLILTYFKVTLIFFFTFQPVYKLVNATLKDFEKHI